MELHSQCDTSKNLSGNWPAQAQMEDTGLNNSGRYITNVLFVEYTIN